MSADLRNIGARLANVAYNFAQDEGLPDHVRGILGALQKEWDAAVRDPAAAAQQVVAVPEGFALTLVDRSYDQRAKAIIAFNTCAGDLDDKLGAAYAAALTASPSPQADQQEEAS